jgi:hypothetical protein
MNNPNLTVVNLVARSYSHSANGQLEPLRLQDKRQIETAVIGGVRFIQTTKS